VATIECRFLRCKAVKAVFGNNPINPARRTLWAGGPLRSVWFLYGAAFTMAIAISVWWTAMPFVVRNIGGTESHVGYAWAANMFGYMLCLLLTGAALGQHNPKNTTRIAVAVNFASALAMGIAVYVILSRGLVGNLVLIWLVIAAGTVAGAAMSLFWPFLMSWVSEDFEGRTLNRRLGTYNGMWSAAAMIGPLLSGVLVEAGTPLPIVFAVGGFVICFIFLSIASDGSVQTTLFGDVETPSVAGCEDRAALMRFRWMARIVLFSSWACLGVTRSQFALLFTGMGFSETCFGIIITVFGLCNFAMLTAAGKCIFWHFKSVLLLAAQSLLSVSLLMIIFGRALPIFVLSLVIMGFSFGFAYSSHLYYGSCGTKKRSVQMVIHEATISIGIIVGSGAGGYLAKNVGLYEPYWFAIILVAIGFLIQLIILLKGKLAR
jgi:MFS family permease